MFNLRIDKTKVDTRIDLQVNGASRATLRLKSGHAEVFTEAQYAGNRKNMFIMHEMKFLEGKMTTYAMAYERGDRGIADIVESLESWIDSCNERYDKYA